MTITREAVAQQLTNYFQQRTVQDRASSRVARH